MTTDPKQTAEACRFRWNGDDHTQCPRCGGTGIDPVQIPMTEDMTCTPQTATNKRGEALISISVKSLSTCHVGLHFAVEHALSTEQAEQFHQVRREIFHLIRNAMRKQEKIDDAQS